MKNKMKEFFFRSQINHCNPGGCLYNHCNFIEPMKTIQIIILSANAGLLLANLIWMVYSHCQLTKRHMENEKRIKYLQEKYGASEN